MKIILSALALALSLAGCASFHDPVPAGHSGAVATLSDTYTDYTGSTVQFFILQKVDGKRVLDSAHQTAAGNTGRGFRMVPTIVGRRILPIEQTFTLAGYVQFATDAQALFGDNMLVTGDVRFTPRADEEYFVKGTLGLQKSSIWIEDSKGQPVTAKVERIGK